MAGDFEPSGLLRRLSGLAAAAQARNRLWLSRELAEAVARAQILIVGCGGTGSLVAMNCAHLGFRHLTVCDPDVLDASSLNRFIPARPQDIGRRKVDVTADYLRARFPHLDSQLIGEPFPSDAAVDACETAIAVFGCLDAIAPRIALDVLCRSRGRLLIDLGSGFAFDDAAVMVGAGGQVLISRPTGPCLQCIGFNPDGEKHDYFVPRAGLPAPSSLLLNAVIASVAVECLLRELGPKPPPENRVQYDATASTLTPETCMGRRDCPVCGAGGNEHVASVGNRALFRFH
jgi:molybdopterin/thiamine biosynthesis adenylyltransferase